MPVLSFAGIARYTQGEGIPSGISYVLGAVPCALIILNGKEAINARTITLSLALGAALTAVCFSALNGLPLAASWISAKTLRGWALCCLSAILVLRIVLRITEEE